MTIFDGKVKLPEDYFKTQRPPVLPLKYGVGHPTEHHPVSDVTNLTTKAVTPMNCLTCHQPHAGDRQRNAGEGSGAQHGILPDLPQQSDGSEVDWERKQSRRRRKTIMFDHRTSSLARNLTALILLALAALHRLTPRGRRQVRQRRRRSWVISAARLTSTSARSCGRILRRSRGSSSWICSPDEKVDPNLFSNKNQKAKQKWMDRLAGEQQTRRDAGERPALPAYSHIRSRRWIRRGRFTPRTRASAQSSSSIRKPRRWS